jgi:uncharacterized protein YeaO (DUF488 family)
VARGSGVRVKRIYEEPAEADGTRVLVDRLWPRGLAKDKAGIDEWLKAVAPSDDLRRWYGHDPERFGEFQRRYAAELKEPDRAMALLHLRKLARSGTLTLLTASRDVERSQAAELARHLREPGAQADPGEAGDPACWLNRVCPNCGTIAGSDPPVSCPNCGTEIAIT